ncbi:DUF4082 domain-containing protein [Salipiger mucosus]|uniref:DUF4082 domain-containing protein n=1 Tax=Salipiger mucosus DSM 16094 TaxID=1123237 RepID=S9RP46_9RHOB|nr:DUF4082 domain-containing protein [Salipiger mucosus]EPX75779.1 hypothetical protein Salmuc_05417 [Salipiger mucosus DSM 16094]
MDETGTRIAPSPRIRSPGSSSARTAQGLVRASASTDAIPATTTLVDLPATVSTGTPLVLTGVATDDDGNPATDDGVVGVVEVSVDGGATWQVADGRGTWTYTWTPTVAGTYEVLARAIDDSVNLPGAAILASDTVEVTAPEQPNGFSLFDPYEVVTGTSYNDGQPVSLGVRFEATETGAVTALKYWRTAADADDTDTRPGYLWDAGGTLLATVTFTSAPGNAGWQVATLDTPVQIAANTEYVVSYQTQDNYLAGGNFFSSGFTDPFGVLTAPSGQNGVYAYGTSLQFPTQSYNSSNYWGDLAFEPGAGVATPLGTLTPAGGWNLPTTPAPEAFAFFANLPDALLFRSTVDPDPVAPGNFPTAWQHSPVPESHVFEPWIPPDPTAPELYFDRDAFVF